MRTSILAASAAVLLAIGFSAPASAQQREATFGTRVPVQSVTAKPSNRRYAKSQVKSKRKYAKAKASKRRVARASVAYRSTGSVQSGIASYYWQPQRVASGGWFNPNAMTAAHRSLPFGTKVRVTNQRNGKSVVVTINDRGPFIAGRIIDLSAAAAGAINMKSAGIVPVTVTVLGR